MKELLSQKLSVTLCLKRYKIWSLTFQLNGPKNGDHIPTCFQLPSFASIAHSISSSIYASSLPLKSTKSLTVNSIITYTFVTIKSTSPINITTNISINLVQHHDLVIQWSTNESSYESSFHWLQLSSFKKYSQLEKAFSEPAKSYTRGNNTSQTADKKICGRHWGVSNECTNVACSMRSNSKTHSCAHWDIRRRWQTMGNALSWNHLEYRSRV